MSDERIPRDAAAWTSLAVASLILLIVVGLVGAQIVNPRDPAAPTASIGTTTTAADGSHHVEVTVSNVGDETAANVQVNATLTIDGEETTADQVIDFLAGSEDEHLVFVFGDDPADGELEVVVSGYEEP